MGDQLGLTHSRAWIPPSMKTAGLFLDPLPILITCSNRPSLDFPIEIKVTLSGKLAAMHSIHWCIVLHRNVLSLRSPEIFLRPTCSCGTGSKTSQCWHTAILLKIFLSQSGFLRAFSIHWDPPTAGRDGVEENELLTASTAGTGRETDPELKVAQKQVVLD